jgi:alkanesulfonate monooxygenase SsuD/methylene tetrahydromethanopterin reductase-like flavin-dependent oxidoreductase (luciferase family)
VAASGVDVVANYTSWTIDPREFAREAEAGGFAGVSCSDHFFRTSAYPHLWVTLAAMAASTERVFLTSSFANNLFRSPVEFAQASLTMQALSDGRFEAGLGAGWLAPEVVQSGLEYPDPKGRARRYHEAILIVRELFEHRCCTFDGEHYSVDIPLIGPVEGTVGDGNTHSVVPTAPPLVASLGGPWTIRTIAPLVDRVELKFGASTRGGDLDTGVLAVTTIDDLRAAVAAVREVAPEVPIGTFAMIAVGDDAEVAPFKARFGEGLYSGFVGSPAQVSEYLNSLREYGIDRVQLTEMLKGSTLRLTGIWG